MHLYAIKILPKMKFLSFFKLLFASNFRLLLERQKLSKFQNVFQLINCNL